MIKPLETILRTVAPILRKFAQTVTTVCAIPGGIADPTGSGNAIRSIPSIEANETQATAAIRRSRVVNIGSTLRYTRQGRDGVERESIDSRSIADGSRADSISFEDGGGNVFSVATPDHQGIRAGKDAIGCIEVPCHPFVKAVIGGHID
jgi:hypothetical protein